MPQLIFASTTNYIKTTVLDITDINIFWDYLFNYIHETYHIPKDIILIKSHKGKNITHDTINPFSKFNHKNFCYYNSKGQTTQTYLINFDIRI